MTTPTVSLLGLGRMGEPIARRLLTSLRTLTVWNRTPNKCGPLGRAGAHVAPTPSAAAAPITLTVLTDLADVKQILRGPDGLLSGWATAGIDRPVLVVHGTVSPVGVAQLAKQLARSNIDLVDAPLSGGVDGAESGNLSVMVGGTQDAVDRAWPILTQVGSTVRHLGPSGAGQTGKACNQVVVAATVTAIAEALVLADQTGIDRSQLLELFSGGLADSQVLQQKKDRWLAGDFHGGGSSVNQLKDLRFATEAAAAHGADLPLTSTLRHVFEQAVADGDGDLDHAGVELCIARHLADHY
ncbi:MAG: 2-hydroxy-3-oxopropionate reductase [Propionibacteriaceae bacterium]|jgi:3-hydroxyisobutyrate dehydrogenase-like beta-hydroxyacid dehydrogenase|nr:2-hydroxy-3-oxopropionate reductase [Propionibacteriaceae bacterium]